MEPNEVQFISEKELITIIPNFSENRITLLTGNYGPFNPSMPVTVPLWVAISLKKQHRCHIQPPNWLNIDVLSQKLQEEKQSELFIAMPSLHFIEISTILLTNAPDDMCQPDELRALIRDIWDLRTAKLRRSIDIMITQQATHSKVDNLTLMEINTVRSFLTQSLDQLHILRNHADQYN